MDCPACFKPILESERLVCVKCKKAYHYPCLNMTSSYFLGNRFDLLNEWKCQSCSNVTLRRKGDETPVSDPHKKRPKDLDVKSSTSTSTASASAVSPQLSAGLAAGSVTIEQIAQLLDSKLDERDEKLCPKLSASIQSSLAKQFKQELNKYFEQIKVEFTKSLEFLSGQLSDMKSNVSGIEARLSVLENENTSLKNEVSALKSRSHINSDASELKSKIVQLNSELNERDQAMLINDIEIAGIPEFPGESVTSLVTSVAAKLGVKLDARDVVHAAREGAPRSAAGAAAANGPAAVSGPAKATRMRPRRIVVRLARQALRDDLLHAARVRRDVTTADLGLPHHVPVRIYINERLTRMNRVLLGKAREAKREQGWRFVWTREGRIYARRDDTPASRTQRLRNEDDLVRVFGKGPVGQNA